MSEPTTAGVQNIPQQPAGQPAPDSRGQKTGFQRFMSGSVGRNLGLVVALLLLIVVGAITAPDTFTSVSNILTILRQASIIGVISIGMTLVIIAGGIDLSVGSVMGLASVVATIAVVQNLADQSHWIVMIVAALAVGLAAGLINGVVIAYGKVVAFMATLAMLVAARGLAEILAERRTLPVGDRGFIEFMNADIIGVDILIWIFAIVAALGWVLLNRTTFGRRTVAIGGNREAARLAGINVKRHTMWLYAIVWPVRRYRGRHDPRAHHRRHLDPRSALRTRRDRRSGRGWHAARRRTRHHHRHRLRRPHLRHPDERVRAEQHRLLCAGGRKGHHHRHRCAAAAALRQAHRTSDMTDAAARRRGLLHAPRLPGCGIPSEVIADFRGHDPRID